MKDRERERTRVRTSETTHLRPAQDFVHQLRDAYFLPLQMQKAMWAAQDRAAALAAQEEQRRQFAQDVKAQVHTIKARKFRRRQLKAQQVANAMAAQAEAHAVAAQKQRNREVVRASAAAAAAAAQGAPSDATADATADAYTNAGAMCGIRLCAAAPPALDGANAAAVTDAVLAIAAEVPPALPNDTATPEPETKVTSDAVSSAATAPTVKNEYQAQFSKTQPVQPSSEVKPVVLPAVEAKPRPPTKKKRKTAKDTKAMREIEKIYNSLYGRSRHTQKRKATREMNEALQARGKATREALVELHLAGGGPRDKAPPPASPPAKATSQAPSAPKSTAAPGTTPGNPDAESPGGGKSPPGLVPGPPEPPPSPKPAKPRRGQALVQVQDKPAKGPTAIEHRRG